MNVNESPLQDASPNNKDGTLSATAPVYNASGKFGGCFNFTNSADYAYSPTGVHSGTGDLSYGCWINTTESVSNHHIMNIGEADTSKMAFIMHHTGGKIKFGWWGSDFSASTSVNDGAWHQVYVTFDDDAASDNWLCYIDGVADTAKLDDSTLNVTDLAVYVGAYRGDPTNSSYNYNGSLDEVAIFSQLLSSTEINDIMDNGLVGGAPAARRMFTVF